MSYNPCELNKALTIERVSSCHHQETVTLDKLNQNSESTKLEEISQENSPIASYSSTTSLNREVGSREWDEIEEILVISSSDSTPQLFVEPASSYAIPRK